MGVVIVIPARHASTRHPGKPLVELRGAGGQARSLIRRSWDAARQVQGADRVIVATDDARIADHAAAFGAEVAMTSPDCRNGTERCAEVLAGLPERPEMIVNLQGDAPLTPPWFVEALVAAMAADETVPVATPVLRLEAATYDLFAEDRRAGRVGGTTAVFDRRGRALYFSKEIVPFVDGARLDRAALQATVLDRADLRGASLDGVDLSAAVLRKTKLDLAGAVLLAELHGADVDP